MPIGNASVDDLQQSIIEMVNQHWDENKSIMFLTELGVQIRKFFPNSNQLMPDGLRSFILENNVAQIVSHPDTPVKVGAIPLGVHIPADVTALFAPRKGPRRSVNLVTEFWNAFHLPLVGRRFVTIAPDTQHGFIIQNLSTGEPAEEKWYEIGLEDLALNDGSAVSDLVRRKWQKINAWISRHGLDIHAFSVRESALRDPQSSTITGHLRHRDIGVFSQLEQQDQARILIPLDILIKLFNYSR